MDLEQIYKNETGEEATWRYDREDLYTVEYVKWLEERVKSPGVTSTVMREDGVEFFVGEIVMINNMKVTIDHFVLNKDSVMVFTDYGDFNIDIVKKLPP